MKSTASNVTESSSYPAKIKPTFLGEMSMTIKLKDEGKQTAIYLDGEFQGVVDKPINEVRKMTLEEIATQLS